MKTYKVRVEYREHFTVTVEAESEKEAEQKGIEEAEELLRINASAYSVDTEEVE